MGTFKDLTGQKFNRLTVLGLGERNSSGQIQWKFKCDCGNIVFATTTYLDYLEDIEEIERLVK